MGRTQLTGDQIKDGHIYREDINTQTSGKALITKLIIGAGLDIQSTGIDSGTGDVTISVDSTSLSEWTVVIAENDYSAVHKNHIFLDGTGVLNITLPTSPSTGDRIKVTDFSGLMTTYNAVINRNGNNIMGLAENFNIDLNYVTCVFVYIDSTRGWGIEF